MCFRCDRRHHSTGDTCDPAGSFRPPPVPFQPTEQRASPPGGHMDHLEIVCASTDTAGTTVEVYVDSSAVLAPMADSCAPAVVIPDGAAKYAAGDTVSIELGSSDESIDAEGGAMAMLEVRPGQGSLEHRDATVAGPSARRVFIVAWGQPAGSTGSPRENIAARVNLFASRAAGSDISEGYSAIGDE